MEELIDVLDENGVKTGEVMPRSEIHKKGLWHRAIVIAIVNMENKILLQQRSFKKEKNAGKWDISVAGHIQSGQDSISAACREINEEVSFDLGFNVSVKDFRYMFSYRVEQVFNEKFIERQFYDFFILRKDVSSTEDIEVDKSEVECIKWVSLSELNKMIDNKELVERDAIYKELINYIFKM